MASDKKKKDACCLDKLKPKKRDKKLRKGKLCKNCPNRGLLKDPKPSAVLP